ncbi:MAG: hypothetical protein GY705_29315, partial [Bacteroidetes bacterium]|nr:hypothetical protein [Bacteroidota bacterium]
MILKSLAPSTIGNYSKTIENYKLFISKLEDSDINFPVNTTHITMYMVFLFNKGFSPATIRSKLSAISCWHQLYGLHDPTSDILVRRTLNGMKKERPSKFVRPPIMLKDLHKMYEGISVLDWSSYNKMMVKSLILLSFHAFLRPGEAVDSVNSLQLADIQTGSNSLKIKFKKFKHCKGIP